MKSTIEQLVNLLGRKKEITINADLVEELDLEYKKIKQENKILNKQIEIQHSAFMASVEETCEYATILEELEKWLNEKLNKASVEEYVIIMSCLDKLQELKGEC